LLKVLIRLLYSSDDTAHFKRGLIGSIDGRTRRGNRKVLIVKGSRDLDWRAPSPSPEESTAYPRNVSPVRRARRLGASFCHQFHRPTSWTGGSIPLRAPGTFGAD